MRNPVPRTKKENRNSANFRMIYWGRGYLYLLATPIPTHSIVLLCFIIINRVIYRAMVDFPSFHTSDVVALCENYILSSVISAPIYPRIFLDMFPSAINTGCSYFTVYKECTHSLIIYVIENPVRRMYEFYDGQVVVHVKADHDTGNSGAITFDTSFAYSCISPCASSELLSL